MAQILALQVEHEEDVNSSGGFSSAFSISCCNSN
jgi:hypothetical protein